MSASNFIAAAFTITVSPDAVFNGNPGNDPNACPAPASVRLYFQERGDDLSGANGKQYYRWWAINGVVLAPGSSNMSVSLADLSQWSNVLGERADSSAAAITGFHQAIANIADAGVTFGGCFYGHGVGMNSGGANFIMNNFALQ